MAKKVSSHKSYQHDSLHQLQQKLEEAEISRKRIAADYANFQRRVEDERAQLHERASTKVLEELFPIIDNLARASQHAPEISVDTNFGQLTEDDFKKIANYFAGLRMIEKQLEEVLAALGLTRIKTTGEVFNPNLHEAISYEPNPAVPVDHIIGEIESGWQINGRVVRPAKVRVSQG